MTQTGQRAQLGEILLVTLEVKRFEPRAACNQAKRKADGGIGERKLLQTVGDVAQTVDVPDDGNFHMEPLQTGKVTQELQILHRVSQQPQFDIAPAVPEVADPLHIRIGLGLLDAQRAAAFGQRTLGIEPKCRVVIDVAAKVRVSDGFAAHIRAGAAVIC